MIRKAEQAGDLEAAGAEPVLCDLERGDDLRPHLDSADAIVFAAGAGPGSGPERKRTVDYGTAVAAMEAASETGVARYVIVSSIGTHDVDGAAEAMRPYLQAKRDADAALRRAGSTGRSSSRAGSPTHPAPAASGQPHVRARDAVPRDDVALVLLNASRRRTPSASSSSCSRATSRRARPSALSRRSTRATPRLPQGRRGAAEDAAEVRARRRARRWRCSRRAAATNPAVSCGRPAPRRARRSCSSVLTSRWRRAAEDVGQRRGEVVPRPRPRRRRTRRPCSRGPRRSGRRRGRRRGPCAAGRDPPAVRAPDDLARRLRGRPIVPP